MADSAWRFSVLGPVRGWGPHGELDLGSPQQRELLALLVLRPGRAAMAEELIEALWGYDTAPKGALSTIRTYASRLRRVLAVAEDHADPISSVAGGYALSVDPSAVDALAFEAGHSAAAGLRAAGDLAGAARRLHEALELWQGEPLAGLTGPFATAQRSQWCERRLAALEARIALDLEVGRHAAVTVELAALAAEFPLRERFRELQMLALSRSGRKAEALAVYDQTRRTLAEELGVDPGPDLQLLHRQVMAGLDGPDPGGGGAAGGTRGGIRGEAQTVVAAEPENPASAAPSYPDTPSQVPATAAAPAQLPADVADFTGRAAWSGQLLDLIKPGDAMPLAVLSGIGGTGKSTLAVHTAHLAAARFPDGQLFAALRGTDREPADPGGVLGGFLRALGTDPGAVPNTVQERTALFRSTLAGRRVLIVLDDVRDAAQIRPLLPGTPGCAVLATSRSRLTGVPGARMLELGAFQPDEALALFRAVAGAERVAGDEAAVRRAVAVCGHLPLAVRILASRLAARPHWTAETLAGRLCDEARRLDELRAGDLAVEATFRLGYEQLHGEQARAFRLLAVPDGPDIGVEAVAALLDRTDLEAEDLVEELVDLCLVESPSPGRYRLHALLRMFARRLGAEIDGPDVPHTALDRLIRHYLRVAAAAANVANHCAANLVGLIAEPTPSDAPGDAGACLEWAEREREAACAAATQALLSRQGGTVGDDGPVPAYRATAPTASTASTSIASTSTSTASTDDIDVVDAGADLLYWLGILCQSGPGDQDLARLAAVVIDEADRDDNRRAEVVARFELAHSLSQSWFLAEAHIQAAAAVAAARDLPEPGYLLEALSVLAANHWRAGRDEESMRASAEALHLLEQTDAGWEQLSEAQLNLSQSLCRLQRAEEARELAERGLTLRRAFGDASSLAYGLHASGMVLREAGFPDRAAACHREASDIHRSIGQQRRLGWSRLRLAEALADQGVYHEALEAAGQAVEILTELGDRPGRGLALALAGRIRDRRGDAAGARAAWQDAYAVFEGTSSPVTVELRKLLGLDAGPGAVVADSGAPAGPEPAEGRGEQWPAWMPRHPVPPRGSVVDERAAD
ncbi:winged helix-turn-helix domain-containing protein [Catenulispora sp. NF23]|uniref:AfsR/SARP family transcriptional regulator n=1 Tax=Catenulispora pinistramenti TaxID=2705254 RepID=UPI001BACA3E4|nr:AfsR/SARP family transcriptional regulator [Catenulispora pinistramenti]MBS2533385.1 winged helix-turn-helix domain-containing protein [Catenulispora pinistramenti]